MQQDHDLVIDTQGLSKHYNGVEALKSLSEAFFIKPKVVSNVS